MTTIDTSLLAPFIGRAELDRLGPRVEAAHRAVLEKTGPGNDFLGWMDLVRSPNDALLEDIGATADHIRQNADVLVCIGIGGSYLGSLAVIQALSSYFPRHDAAGPEILFAGHHLSGTYLAELLGHLEGKSVFVNAISKSGTTLEPAIAFRALRKWMEEHFDDADERIIVTTDRESGKLNELRKIHGYKHYTIPDDVGGRFSVLTPVGLLPIASAGVDIRALYYGAVEEAKNLTDSDSNPALEYAAARYLLHEKGYAVEALAVFEPRLLGVARWWQQLFGESEGKEHRGLFPVMLQYTTDLHSVGQYMQDGQRHLIETFLLERSMNDTVTVPAVDGPDDGLSYLAGKPVDFVNRKAYEGTARAHAAGGVPIITLSIGGRTPGDLGGLIYFFEHAVAVGGYLLGVNPFDQPGVEAYKAEMYALLGKN